jgi:transcriptional regulator with XRE-family HTH domain
MSAPTIAGKRPVYSDSNALEAIGRALHEIKAQDGLTWTDVGKVLGVSDDQAAKYANGMAAMSVSTFGRGKREWNGRLTRYFDALCEESRPGNANDHLVLTAVLDAAAKLAHMLEDGEIRPQEVRDHRKELEAAYDAIGAQLGKLKAVA